MKPNIIVIGAQKAGSTWFHAMLGDHPDIFMSETKELQYFDQGDHTDDGFVEYMEHFTDGSSLAYRGESTPGYFWTSRKRVAIPQRIKHRLGNDVRFFLALRNPVERAISAYWHHLRHGRLDLTKSFMHNFRAAVGDIEQIGHYKQHWLDWRAVYGREHFFVEQFDNIKTDGQSVAQAAYAFLGLEPHIFKEQGTQFNRGVTYKKVGDAITVVGELHNRIHKRYPDLNLDDREALPGLRIPDSAIAELYEVYAEDIAFCETEIFGTPLGWEPRS
ncbi:sulfotransferase domain-containing protein [Dinoroseobacter sp. S375]|uniref:sulfotransferase domain-containing protein n=1 Tax=Dinoroseobacter sp. S375 TaxID=3415136 RepID=UPI003C79A34A